MSYNIIGHEVMEGTLTLTGAQIRELVLKVDRPEQHLFEDFDIESIEDGTSTLDPDEVFEIDPLWQSEYSGTSFDTLIEKILPLTKGSMDIIYTWEEGGTEGIRVRDGVVTKHHIVMTLGDEILRTM